MKRVCCDDNLVNPVAYILPQETDSHKVSKLYSINLIKFRSKYSNFNGNLIPYTNIGSKCKINDLIDMFRIKYIESKRNFLSFKNSRIKHFMTGNFGYNNNLQVFINFFESSFLNMNYGISFSYGEINNFFKTPFYNNLILLYNNL